VVFSYRAYGLNCVSDTPIAGFSPDPLNSKTVDIYCSINSQQPKWVRQARALPSRLFYAEPRLLGTSKSNCTLTSYGSDEFFELAYGDGAQFVIDDPGSRLWAAGQPPLSVDDLAAYIRGPIMGFVLRRRGITSLHAGAACTGAQAILLCGTAEAGKSTTLGALASRGISILSDDIAALQEKDGRFQVEPGYPWICLWPDSVSNLFGKPDALPQITPTWEKRYLALGTGGFEPARRPIGAIYLIARRSNDPSAPCVECISSREAVLELVQNTYMNWLLDKDQRAAELDVLIRLASNVPVRRVIPHSDPERINKLCDLIVSDSEVTLRRSSLLSLNSRQ